ncbi:hypothetical protein C0583_00230 [Candidatus Parcubacteria bacterium]|nr:MAG: hypothetical protein C0583_00230 [Candidatus Parcubacteria bacterium]
MKDTLSRKIYAQKIADEIVEKYNSEKKACEYDGLNKTLRYKKCRDNMIFAISGKWGEGKTRLLNLIEKPLNEQGFKVIWFNPWKYSQQDITLKRAFLSKIKKRLDKSVDLSDLYYDRTKTTINLKNIDWKFIFYSVVFVVLLLSLLLVCLIWIGMPMLNYTDVISSFFGNKVFNSLVYALLFTIFVPILMQIIVQNRSSASISTAEEFEDIFNKLIKGEEKIVFFIDDLDRCSSKTLKLILDSIKTFFLHDECSYIITGDHTVIEKYAANELQLDEDLSPQKKTQEGRRFLKKLFDIYWRMPLPTPAQFNVFIDEELKTAGIDWSDAQKNNFKIFLTDDNLFERNPRHVKRFITKVRFAIEGAKLMLKEIDQINNQDPSMKEKVSSYQEIISHPDLLAKILLIEEFFYPIYEKLILHPENLIHHEKLIRRCNSISDFKINNQNLFSILNGDSITSDQQIKLTIELETYLNVLKRHPKFTDEYNSTIFEVGNFLSISGSTGLPSSIGPDETDFLAFLKKGMAFEKLGKLVEVAKEGKKEDFVQKALVCFESSEDETVRYNILLDVMAFSASHEEWIARLDEWWSKIKLLSEEKKGEIVSLFFKILLIKNPTGLKKITEEMPAYKDKILEMFNSNNFVNSLSKEAHKVIKEYLLESIQTDEPSDYILALNKYFNLHEDDDLQKALGEAQDDSSWCIKLLKALNEKKIDNGRMYKQIIKNTKPFLEEFENLQWVIENKELFKNNGLLIYANEKITNQTQQNNELLELAQKQEELEMADSIKMNIKNKIIGKLGSVDNFNDFNTEFIKNLLSKNSRIDLLKNYLIYYTDNKKTTEQRKAMHEYLNKNNNLWLDIDITLIRPDLNKFKKANLQRNHELIQARKDVLQSWGLS